MIWTARGMRMLPAPPSTPRAPAPRPRPRPFFAGRRCDHFTDRGLRAHDEKMNDGRTDFFMIDCR